MVPAILSAAGTSETAIRLIAKGLLWEDANFIASALGVTLETFADLISVPRSTFFRRRGVRFAAAESEHIMRFARLWHIALAVFPNEKAARSWLSRPQYGLDGAIPLEYSKTELGARTVEDLMMRIHYGVLA